MGTPTASYSCDILKFVSCRLKRASKRYYIGTGLADFIDGVYEMGIAKFEECSSLVIRTRRAMYRVLVA